MDSSSSNVWNRSASCPPRIPGQPVYHHIFSEDDLTALLENTFPAPSWEEFSDLEFYPSDYTFESVAPDLIEYPLVSAPLWLPDLPQELAIAASEHMKKKYFYPLPTTYQGTTELNEWDSAEEIAKKIEIQRRAEHESFVFFTKIGVFLLALCWPFFLW